MSGIAGRSLKRCGAVYLFECAFTFTSEETFVTPCVSRARAIARPTWPAESAEPLRVTSPLLDSTSIMALAVSLSAWSLPLTIVLTTSSSVAPVGAPTTLSLVRTIVTPRSRSVWISVGLSRHSVIRVVISVVAVADAVSVLLRLELGSVVDAVAPVVLLELGLAPAVPVVELLWSVVLREASLEATALLAPVVSVELEDGLVLVDEDDGMLLAVEVEGDELDFVSVLVVPLTPSEPDELVELLVESVEL